MMSLAQVSERASAAAAAVAPVAEVVADATAGAAAVVDTLAVSADAVPAGPIEKGGSSPADEGVPPCCCALPHHSGGRWAGSGA